MHPWFTALLAVAGVQVLDMHGVWAVRAAVLAFLQAAVLASCKLAAVLASCKLAAVLTSCKLTVEGAC